MRKAFLALGLACIVSACSTTRVPLKYEPPATKTQAPENAQAITIGSFADERGEKPTWLGSIRGGYGNPLKTLETERPVSELFKEALAQALKARGYALPAEGATREITCTIRELGCNQYMNRTADVKVEMAVFDTQSGQQRFSRTYEISDSEFSAAQGVFGSVDDLRAMAEKALRGVLDKALDDSAMRNALK